MESPLIQLDSSPNAYGVFQSSVIQLKSSLIQLESSHSIGELSNINWVYVNWQAKCGQKSLFSNMWNSFSNIWNSFSYMWQCLTKWDQRRKNHNFVFLHHKSPLYVASVNMKYLMENATNKKVMGQLVMVPKQVSCVVSAVRFWFHLFHHKHDKTHMAITKQLR